MTSGELRKALDPTRKNNFTLGPLYYFAEKRVAVAVEGTASIETESSDGVLLSIDAPYPWAASVDRFEPCYARLDNAGLLQWPHRRQGTA